MSFSWKSFGTLLDPRHKADTLKIKVHMCLCAHTSRDKGVRYHSASSAPDFSGADTYTYADAHKASSNWILPQ